MRVIKQYHNLLEIQRWIEQKKASYLTGIINLLLRGTTPCSTGLTGQEALSVYYANNEFQQGKIYVLTKKN